MRPHPMKPWWIRYDPEIGKFELRGVWAKLAKEATDQQVKVLILQQLCFITVWLTIIAACSVVSACCLVVG